MIDKLSNRYFDWMCHLVNSNNIYNKLSYRKLLMFLHNVDFVPIVEFDDNRAQDGIDFRYRFGYEVGIPRNEIEQYLDRRHCSVLEMMIALAFDIEEQIMDDADYGDRTGQWFWSMIVSLGLGSMSDDRFDENYGYFVMDRFLNRDYEPNGKGGLFTIQNCTDDLRYIDIWTQCMWYLNEVIEL